MFVCITDNYGIAVLQLHCQSPLSAQFELMLVLSHRWMDGWKGENWMDKLE